MVEQPARLPDFKVTPKVVPGVQPFGVTEVELLAGPWLHAQKMDEAYLLRLEPDRLLHNFRKFAGLEPKGPIYGGWERMGIAGHSLGHYLSACARMYHAAKNPEFLRRVGYIVEELAACQQAMGTGYVAGIPEGQRVFAEVAAGKIQAEGFSLNGVWVPWYTLHKLFAGLIDAYALCGNEQALRVACGLADWVDATTKNLTERQWQEMLQCEHGGMNESLALLYLYTGEPRYLDLARKFYHRRVLDFLARREDRLAGLHANTQIPKVIGVARLYEITGEERFRTIATFFWDTVVANHTYVNGGNSSGEYFGPPGRLSDRLVDTTETCNTYNMLKLTQILFCWSPEVRYADYCERALWNHILAHQHPETGMMVYKGFLDPGTRKQYSTPFDSFWCCVGTGMENHARYGEYIYFRDADGVYVNQFVASRLRWPEKGLILEQQTGFPEESTTQLLLQLQESRRLLVRIRHPWWARGDVTVRVNGESVATSTSPSQWIVLDRQWQDGDRLKVEFPMHLYYEAMPDNPRMIAFLYGPVVLCAPLEEGEQIPTVVCEGDPVTRIVPRSGQPLCFDTRQLGRPRDLSLVPLYRMHDSRYNVYWEWLTPAGWELREQQRAEERKRMELLRSLVIDEVQIGDPASERQHGLAGERTEAGRFSGRWWRHAVGGGWFAWALKSHPERPMALWCTYWGSDVGGREFDVLVDGTPIAHQVLQNNAPGKFFEVIYPIPPELTRGKETITVRFQARPGRMAGGVFGCRTILRPEDPAVVEGGQSPLP
jgi:DUF1680 family protein